MDSITQIALGATVGVAVLGWRLYPHDPSLLEPLQHRWAVRRLQDFTKGFHAVQARDRQVVMIDLRMGQVGFYPFAFVVGRQQEGMILPVSNQAYGFPRPDLGQAFNGFRACFNGQPSPQIASC